MTIRNTRLLIIAATLILAIAIMVPTLTSHAAGSVFDLANIDNGSITVYYMSDGPDALKIGVKTNGSEQYTTYRSGVRANISLPEAGGQVTVSLYKKADANSFRTIEQISFMAKGTSTAQKVQSKSSSSKIPTFAAASSVSEQAPVQAVPAAAPEVRTTESTTATHVTAVPEKYSKYLASVKEISFQAGDSVSQKAAELVAGKGTTEAKAMAIYNYIARNFSYDWDLYDQVVSGRVTRYTPDPNSILPSKKGICYDIASLYAAMCRSVGIPTKMVKGDCKKTGGYHAWNSVYDDAADRWVSVDITLNLGARASSSWRSIGSGYSASSAV